MVACTPCLAGKARPNLPQGAACSECPVGTYSSVAGTVECRLCPSFSTTVAPGATSIDECGCVQGYYGVVDGGGELLCNRCPEGSTTAGSGGLGVESCNICQVGLMSTADEGCKTCAEILGSSIDGVDCSVLGASVATLPVI